jgi:Domain of unknown function (DUF6046)
MANVIIDIDELYAKVFGVTAKIQKQLSGVGGGTIFRQRITLSYAGDIFYNPDSYTLPNEPIVTIMGKNTITRKPVLKNSGIGTIKEMWTADDWEIEIKGILIGDVIDELPEKELNRLRWYREIRRAVEVKNNYLNLMGISYMVIESIDFPPTTGYEYQIYTIKGFSDKPHELIV